MRRKRSTPWIQRKARFLLAAIATVGAIVTAYIAITQLVGGEAACPIGGCDRVLTSRYAKVFGGIPLALFGFAAYAGIGASAIAPWLIPQENKELRNQVDRTTWWFLFIGSAAMTVFSGYLIYLIVFVIQSFCLYCVLSALCCFSLFAIVLNGRDWEDIWQLIFVAFIVSLVTVIGTVGIYAERPDVVEKGIEVTSTSGPAEIALAEHLSEIDAKMYGAFWCPHCWEQKQLFGKEAAKKILYIECAEEGVNAQPEVCRAAGVNGYPTWKIQGATYANRLTLEELTRYSGYEGPQNFQNSLETLYDSPEPTEPSN